MSAIKKILITGVTGQDGSHMADFLLKTTEIYHYLKITEFS